MLFTFSSRNTLLAALTQPPQRGRGAAKAKGQQRGGSGNSGAATSSSPEGALADKRKKFRRVNTCSSFGDSSSQNSTGASTKPKKGPLGVPSSPARFRTESSESAGSTPPIGERGRRRSSARALPKAKSSADVVGDLTEEDGTFQRVPACGCGLYTEGQQSPLLADKIIQARAPPAMPPPPLPAAFASMPPPPLPAGYGSPTHNGTSTAAPISMSLSKSGSGGSAGGWHQQGSHHSGDDWGTPAMAQPAMAAAPPVHQQHSQNDDFDDDWSDEESQAQEIKSKMGGAGDSSEDRHFLTVSAATARRDRDSSVEDVSPARSSADEPDGGSGKESGGFGVTRGQSQRSETGSGTAAGKAGVKKNINRFSHFVKSGFEAYILDSSKPSAQPNEKIDIVMSSADGIIWAPPRKPFSVRIDSPKKSTKMHGLKSFIAYQLTPSDSNLQVSRRYKHFDWLHERLSQKFPFIPLPPLPEKQVSGRYEDEFIERRMALLQQWVDKICRHPVLSQSAVWRHFISCTDDEKKWKLGKRAAEKDEYVGGNLFRAISAPSQPLDTADVEARVENFSRMVKSLDESVKNFYAMASESAKKMQGPYKREYMKVAASFRSLGQSFELDASQRSGGTAPGAATADALKHTSECYDTVAKLFDDQARVDVEPLLDALFLYRGMLSAFPDVIQTHKSALNKLRDYQKMHEDGKISQGEFEAIRLRVDTISYATLAEIQHFQRERAHDFNDMLRAYLRSQADFYQQIANKLQETLRFYEG